MVCNVLYVSHLLRTKHQGAYHKFVLRNLQPGEAVEIVEHKMKLELGAHLHKNQRDWYGKRGISLHGLLVVAQLEENKKISEVLDLWCKDTKQDFWFSQSAMDVGFSWLQQAFPGFRLYLFSDNGPHYHNSGFLFYLTEVNDAFNLKLVEYNNFEAGEGKSKLDTHFAHISHKIVRWVRVGNNLETGQQLGDLIGSMKYVQCRKLSIDRSKAPNKVGTLKDISLYGSFQFPTAGQYCGGLVARSLAGVGKELKKTKIQVQALVNRSHPIAEATGATTTEEAYSTLTEQRNCFGEPYSIRFIQHASEPVIQVNMIPVEEGLTTRIAQSGYALKSGGAKRVTFTLEQKQVMIEFYNQQANEGIRADPVDCNAAMRERGMSVLKENQIKSWWSSYHHKRRRESERLTADLRQLQGQLTTAASSNWNTAASSATSNINTVPPSTAAATSATSANNQPSATSTATQNANTVPPSTAAATQNANILPLTTSTATQNVNSLPSSTAMTVNVNLLPPSTPIVSLVPSAQPTFADLLGTSVGIGVTEWSFPFNISQSTIGNRNGSNACVFIAFNFGLLYQQCSLDNTLVGQTLNIHWQTALENAITAGNDIHDQLFDEEGVNVTVQEGIDLAGGLCRVRQVYHEYNVFGANPLNQLKTAVGTLSQQRSSFHVLLVNKMANLFLTRH